MAARATTLILDPAVTSTKSEIASLTVKTPTLTRNRIASAALVTATAVTLAATWYAAPVRQVEHTVAASDSASESTVSESLSVPPRTATQLWTEQTRPIGLPNPLVVSGVLILPEENGVRAVDPTTGKELWHYLRDRTLCAATTSEQLVVLTFTGPSGCSETVSLRPESGEYRATRRSSDINDVVPIRSNSYSGVYSHNYLELWRDDLVRVIEYGTVPAPQEPDLQPHPDCSIESAATRVELLAVVNDCTGERHLVIQDANPEESRQPEIHSDTVLNGAGAGSGSTQIVAIGESAAAVLNGDVVTSYSKSGKELSASNIREEAAKANHGEVAPRPGTPRPVTADLPHHMTWYSPYGLVGFDPSRLGVRFVFPQAIGTGVAIGGRLVFPTSTGLAIANWDTGEVEREVPLQRSLPAESLATKNPVTLSVTGNTLIESYGDTITAYTLS